MEKTFHLLYAGDNGPFKSGYKFHGSQRKREIKQFIFLV